MIYKRLNAAKPNFKMYHRDNPNGDTSAGQWLNAEFEWQVQKFK